MQVSRKRTSTLQVDENEELVVRPLGGGMEVGRSCIILEFKGKRIMLDCGIHPGLKGRSSLPFLDLVEIDQIDFLLISHFHLDHCGALPYFLNKTSFSGRCFMTHATKAVYRWILADYVKVSNLAPDEMLYTDEDIRSSMDKIETVNFRQEVDVGGVKFQAYNAGHVLGAAMFAIEIAGIRILYTGDFSRQEDRHLMAAELPPFKPDVLITESTYGTHIHDKREEREARFTGLVHETLNRGGRVLIPVFALGRAQELLLILEEFWEAHPELHDFPVYYASQLAHKCMSVYRTFIYSMNDHIKQMTAKRNPFQFRHISCLKRADDFEQVGPCVVMASPGMLQSGFSRELFESWCIDSRNAVVITGYVVEGTLAKQILNQPAEIVASSGQKLPLNCSVDYVSFSAHTDYQQTSDFIRALKPGHIVLVHGEPTEMTRLKGALIRQYETYNATASPAERYDIDVHTPRNNDQVRLPFRGEKLAKLVGRLAQSVGNLDGSVSDQSKPDAADSAADVKSTSQSRDELVAACADEKLRACRVSGLLVKRNFNYHVVAPDELAQYTDLQTCSIALKQALVYDGSARALFDVLERVSDGHLELLDPSSTQDAFHAVSAPSLDTVHKSKADNEASQTSSKPAAVDKLEIYEQNAKDDTLVTRVYNCAIVRYVNDLLTFEWLAAPLNDSLVDAISIAVLKLVQLAPRREPGQPIRRVQRFVGLNERREATADESGVASLQEQVDEARRVHLRNCVMSTLADMFAIEPDAYVNVDTDTIRVSLNGKSIVINLRDGAVCFEESEQEQNTADHDVLESVSNVVRRLEWILTPSSGEPADYVCCA